MTDDTKPPASEAEVVEAAINAAADQDNRTWKSCIVAALTAARALGVMMPEDAAALKEEVTNANREWDGLLADYANLNDHCNALAERVRVLEGAGTALTDDYQTSDSHHPEWVLVRKSAHDSLRAALSSTEARPNAVL